MGISLIPALFFARNAKHVKDAKSAIILGRQKIHMPERKLERFVSAAKAYGFDLKCSDVVQDDGFSENLLDSLGYPHLDAMDFTDSEGAEYIHDLNKPVPPKLREKFDLVIDGGTTEHIFYIGQAIDNCYAMLKPGGIMMAYVSCDGWFGHGFFQTGPDVPWRYWHYARGCEMLEVSVICRKTPRNLITVEDPTGKPRGGEMFLEGPHMLMYCCRKPLTAPKYSPPIQSHYV